jgi:hypothetical protein
VVTVSGQDTHTRTHLLVDVLFLLELDDVLHRRARLLVLLHCLGSTRDNNNGGVMSRPWYAVDKTYQKK